MRGAVPAASAVILPKFGLLRSLVGLAMMLTRRGSMESMLPFGCFLAVGAAFAATIGPPVMQWYFRLF